MNFYSTVTDQVSESKSDIPIQLISQGAYGCIFKPGMNCKGELEKEGYITKIQNDEETTRNEYEIGKILLQSIDSESDSEYAIRFAPILDLCPISIGKIKKNFIEKCNVIQKNASQPVFYSNRIRYVGKNTLQDYFEILFNESNKTSFLSFCTISHIYLLKSLVLLKNRNIVHFDLKENNILIDETRMVPVPVIIDFGLSINMNKLLQEPIDYSMYNAVFYIYYDNYPPWCLEIILISFIVNKNVTPSSSKKKKEWTSNVIKKKDLLSIVEHYFKENYVVKLINDDMKTNYKKQWKRWISTLFRKNLNSKEFVNILIASWKSWDTFGLSVLYFRQLQIFIPNHFLEYHHLLIQNILSIPFKRNTPEEFEKILSAYFVSNKDLVEKEKWIRL